MDLWNKAQDFFFHLPSFLINSFRRAADGHGVILPSCHGLETFPGKPLSILYVSMSPWTILSLPGAASESSCEVVEEKRKPLQLALKNNVTAVTLIFESKTLMCAEF